MTCACRRIAPEIVAASLGLGLTEVRLPVTGSFVRPANAIADLRGLPLPADGIDYNGTGEGN